jgi:carboxymethylenebutenolidase
MERDFRVGPEEAGMRISDGEAESLGRRQLLRRFLIAARVTAVRAALLTAGGQLLLGTGASAAPVNPPAKKPAGPPPPPRPGGPPDKQGNNPVTVSANDPAITAGMDEYPGLVGTLLGYLAAPRGAETYPGVLVLHDGVGLTEHYKDVTRRFSKAGYVALAPDLASRAGGTDKIGDPAKVNAALLEIAPGQVLQDLNAAVRYLEARPLVSKSRIGTIGFGMGGSIMWLILANNSDPKAAVALFGAFPPSRVVPSLKAAVLAIYGEDDHRDPDDAAEFETQMKKAGLPFTLKLEPKAARDFFNDTSPAYVPDAAKDAWGMTLDWFAAHLSA